MKLVGVAIVKNEADVVEAFVRHALHHLDRLVVIDHQSDDATPRILAALRDEGLPLSLHRLEDVAFDHARRMGDALRLALDRHPADAYLALDADEFLRCESPDALREAIARLPPGAPGYLRWQTQVPAPGAAPADEAHVLRRVTHRFAEEPGAQHKVVLPRDLLRGGGWRIATGNHWLLRADDTRFEGVDLARIRLAHLPFRSPAQVVRKAAIGWLGHRLAAGAQARARSLNWHWRGIFEHMLLGRFPRWEDLPALAASAYGHENPQPDAAPPALVHDPLPVHAELRWPELAGIDPLQALLRWTDRLVDEVVR
jgi:hypothetical protein